MAEDGQSSDDRTEAATPRHIDQARDGGRAPISREVTMLATLAVVAGAILWHAQTVARDLALNTASALSDPGGFPLTRLASTARITFAAIWPVLFAASAAGAVAVLLQTNFLLHLGALRPDVGRVSPTAGLRRMFGLEGAADLVRSLVKLTLMTVAGWVSVRGDWQGMGKLAGAGMGVLVSAIAQPVKHLIIAAIAVQTLIAAADLFWVRFRLARDLRMSKQDIRDEMRDTEGNPHVKQRIRRIQVLRARRRMMAKVPGATVVLTNPTHYAVALAYDRVTNPAPRVVAKGEDSLAARIRAVAEENGVPVVSNPPLARALYRLELDAEIPMEYYKAVAEIIAYVWRLRRPKGAG